jgi:hypothetical protein
MDFLGGGDRRVMLCGFLDWYRGVVEHKVDGLTLPEATRVTSPTGVGLLGVVQHLAWVERLWFGHRFLGGPDEATEVDESFVIGPDATVESVVTSYRDACARSREIIDGSPFDAPAASAHDVYGIVTLEWIVVHMIEETARHAGHMDILRELTDGSTGA